MMRPGDTPVPIPNTMVKTGAADGTMLETVWESRRVPDLWGPLQVALRAPLSALDRPTAMHPLTLPLFRKEVIQPHLPIRLPCYDFTPVTGSAFDGSYLAVRPPASGISDSHGVTGGVYKTRERIHRDILIRDY